jgi:dynactin complex subunit
VRSDTICCNAAPHRRQKKQRELEVALILLKLHGDAGRASRVIGLLLMRRHGVEKCDVIYSACMTAAKETTLKEVGEMLTHVVKHMATKDDLAAVETRLDHRIDKLDSKIDRLDTKLTKFEENEIDKRLQLEVRVSTIEKHLGIDKKIAA